MKNKYIYYKDEDNMPYTPGSDEWVWWAAESFHDFLSRYKKEHLDLMKDTCKIDYPQLYEKYGDSAAWEVVCAGIDDAHETAGPDFPKYIEILSRYGDTETA